jgi:hypothetical protein
MNNLGFSNDNLTIIIGNENGGDGYILPNEKGTEGQVITMNADNTTSFQDGGGSGVNIIGIGGGEDIVVTYNGPAKEVPTSVIGARQILLSDIPVGGSVHLNINTRFDLAISGPGSATGTMSISINAQIRNTSNTFLGGLFLVCDNQEFFSGTISVPADFKGYLKLECIITRVAEDKIQGTMTAWNKKYTGQDNPSQQWPNTPTSITADESTIDLLGVDAGTILRWDQFSFFNNYFSSGTVTLRLPSVSYSLRNISNSLTPPPATLDHTQLSNLEFGDSGHTQFALLQGRSGGQVLSGGITPANFLTLKSHTASILNNIIVKDLNTTFEKNIDIGTNQILDGVNNSIDFIGGDMTLLNTSLTNRIVIASQNEIDVLANSQIKLGVPNASNNIVITSADTSLNQALNMNNNNINNVLNINSSSSIILSPAVASSVNINGNVDMGGNNIIGCSQVVGDGGDMTIRNGGGESILLNSATNTIDILNNDLNMNNNNINNVNNLNVSSINNITPVGGLYAGLSDGVVINNTVEQSVLPATGVGSLTVPANGFQVGDSFHCVVAGDCSFDKDDTIQIKLKENGNILAQTPIIDLEDAQSGDNAFEIEIDFTIRSIGVAGSIATNFDFTYNKAGIDSKDFRGTRAMDVQPINTTVASTLDITAQFPTNVTPSSLQTRLFRLQKVY